MFENIDEHVNATLSNQGTPAPATAPIEPTITGTEKAETPTAPSETELLRREIATLKAEAITREAARQDELSEQRLKIAVAQAHMPVARLDTGAQDVRFGQAVRAVGGNVFWHRLSIQQKADALDLGAFANVPLKELKKFFGAESSGAEAMRLSNQQPDLYKQYRLLSKVHGLIG